MIRIVAIFFVSALTVIFLSPSLFAHSITPSVKFYVTDIPPEAASSAVSSAQAGGMNAVVNAFKLWRAGSILKVCFSKGSSTSVKEFFVSTERNWERYANVTWDFGSAPNYRDCDPDSPSHIRIAFDHVGNWSYVGTDAIRSDLIHQTSLNIDIESFGDWNLADKDEVRGTILHEIGHALGLEHEHQSPNDPCIKSIRWDIVYADMGKPPNSWDKQKVDQNFKALVDTDRLRVTAYDQKSIMHYSFPARWFSDSTCAVTQSLELSTDDEKEIKLAYPKDTAQQKIFVNDVNNRASMAATALGLTSSQKNSLAEAIKALPTNLNSTLSSGSTFQVMDNSGNSGVIENGKITIGNVSISGSTTGQCASITGVNIGQQNTKCEH